MSGLDVARVSNGKCNVVFVTAYDTHAIDAFNLAACDYLLKPIQYERLAQSVERVQARITRGSKSNELLQMMNLVEKRLNEQINKV